MLAGGVFMEQDNLIIHPKKYRGDDGYRVFSIRIQEKTIQRLDDLSTRTNRSRNELISILLNYALDRCIIEDECIETGDVT